MRHRPVIFALLVFCICDPSVARAQDTVEIFGGYSYLRPAVSLNETSPVCPVGLLPCPPFVIATTAHPNLNGWEFSGVYNAYHWLGFAADFSGHYGSVNGAGVHYNSYLFGPQLQFHSSVSPFVHALVGVAHETTGQAGTPGVVINATSSTAFALALGAGIDIRLASFVSLRPIQLDDLVTRFNSGTQNQPRASVGLVLHF